VSTPAPAPAPAAFAESAEKKSLNLTPQPSLPAAPSTQQSATFTVTASAPAALPIVDLGGEDNEPNQPLAQQNNAQAASKYIAIPIREQSPPSLRTEQRVQPVAADKVHQAWVAAVQQMLDAESINALVRELAVQSQCVEQGAQHLTLRVEIASLKSDAARDKLQTAFAALGRTEVLTIEQGPVTDSWAKRNQAKIAARQQAAEALILGDPMVQDLQAHWGAKIVPGSIKAL
jgi:DNA polymerase-3 subunit gamma/tau